MEQALPAMCFVLLFLGLIGFVLLALLQPHMWSSGLTPSGDDRYYERDIPDISDEDTQPVPAEHDPDYIENYNRNFRSVAANWFKR